MRTIRKLGEPESLTEHRARPGAIFDKRGLAAGQASPNGNPELSGDAKQELRERLVEEQRGLCCYCCCSIEPTVGGMRIEHWKSIRRFPEHQLDYWNLLAACNGGEGGPSQHCDVHKGSQDLCKNPAIAGHRIEDVVRYLSDGSIRSSHVGLDGELGEVFSRGAAHSGRVLNLNLPFLRNSRKAALDAFKKTLEKRGALQKSTVERMLKQCRGDDGGSLRAFSPVVVWWLKKRLRNA